MKKEIILLLIVILLIPALAVIDEETTLVTVTVNNKYCDLSVTPTLSITASTGETVTEFLTISSNYPGNIGLNVTLSVTGEITSWTTLGSTFLILNPGETRQVSVTISSPSAGGTYNGQIVATSGDGQIDYTDITLTVIANPPPKKDDVPPIIAPIAPAQLLEVTSPEGKPGERRRYKFSAMQKERTLYLEPGETRTVVFYLYNIHDGTPHVRLSAPMTPQGWVILFEPKNLYLEPTYPISEKGNPPTGIEYIEVPGIEGFVKAKVIDCLITIPLETPVGKTYSIEIKAAGDYLDLEGQILFSKTEPIGYTIKTVLHEYEGQIKGDISDRPIREKTMEGQTIIAKYLSLGYIKKGVIIGGVGVILVIIVYGLFSSGGFLRIFK